MHNIQGSSACSNGSGNSGSRPQKIGMKQILEKRPTAGRKRVRGIVIFLLFLMTAFVANRGLKQIVFPSERHTHQAACPAFCTMQTAGDAEAVKQDGPDGVLEQLFCPVVELPVFHGLMVSE